MSIYVFLGPSLPLDQARAALDATFLPPVAMGDLFTLVKTRVKAGDLIGIVDGLFEQVPAVWHKEVLFALSRGARVFGAASMGALRAAELYDFGMIGVGRIFDAYRSGELEDDDEVAVVHGPAERGYKSLSEAMVNVRWGLETAESKGVITAGTRDTLTSLAKSQFYAERSWASVLEAGLNHGLAAEEMDALKRFVRNEKPDAKRIDALALLARLSVEQTTVNDNPTPEFVLEETAYWIGLTQQRAGESRPAASTAPDAPTTLEILNHLRATGTETDSLWRHGLLLRLVADLGGAITVTRDEMDAATQRLCRRHDIGTTAALNEWRIAQQMSKEELVYLLELEARCDVLARKHAAEIDSYVLLELKRRGLLAATSETVSKMRNNLRRLGISKPTLDDAGIDADELQRWYEQRAGRSMKSAEKHAEELGFESLRDFVTELLALYMLDRPRKDVPNDVSPVS